jgi:galactonate dehydratase
VKLVDFRTFVVRTPEPHLGGRHWVFVKLVTDAGVAGVGEVFVTTFGPGAVRSIVHDVCEQHVIGRNPFAIERLWREAYTAHDSMRPDPTLVGALSGIEIACWDIIGKELGRPVYELLGGRVHDRLRTYTYIFNDVLPGGDGRLFPRDPDAAAERAAHYVRQGFTALKFDPIGPPHPLDPRQPTLQTLARCETYVGAVREAVGEHCDILLGTHAQFSPAGAIRVARRLERFDPLWFEEPTPPERPGLMALVARATTIPIAAGERLTTKYEFAQLLEAGAAAIIQPDLGRVGGLLEAKKIAGMAEAHYAHLAPHLYAAPVLGAANIHLAVSSPNFLILEGIETWAGLHAELITPPIRWDAGHIIPSGLPGLGFELDESAVDRYREQSVASAPPGGSGSR